MDTTNIVTMSGVRFSWPGRTPFTLTIESFTLPSRSSLLLLGPSGSGKSTFLSLLCGIVAPQEGRTNILGTELRQLSSGERDRFRAAHFGIIFQMFNLLPYASVRDNVMLPLRFSAGRRRRASEVSEGNAENEAVRLLARLGLEQSIADNASAASLSVGQQQRVAAARALIGRPELIVADEPTSSLDRNRQADFLDLLFAEVKTAGTTLIMVSHDESLAPRFDAVRRLDEFAIATRSPTRC